MFSWQDIDEQLLPGLTMLAVGFPADIPLPARRHEGDHIVAGGPGLVLGGHIAGLEVRPTHIEDIMFSDCILEYCKKTEC